MTVRCWEGGVREREREGGREREMEGGGGEEDSMCI